MVPLSNMSYVLHLALILEEIAIDCHNKETEERLLQEAHDLHLSSLQLAKKAFGEFNVQTAKHYGNLGRLYQSMRKFKVDGSVCLSACLHVCLSICVWCVLFFYLDVPFISLYLCVCAYVRVCVVFRVFV